MCTLPGSLPFVFRMVDINLIMIEFIMVVCCDSESISDPDCDVNSLPLAEALLGLNLNPW